MSRRRSSLGILAVGLLLVPAALCAQSPAQRASIDSLLDVLRRVVEASSLPDERRCEINGTETLHLCRGLIAAKRAELGGGSEAALRAERELRQVVESTPKWASGWYGLGIARLALARSGVPAKPGPLQALGMSWEAGAGHALVRALELDTTDSSAATALALAAIPREGKSQLEGRVAMLRQVRDLLGPAALLGASRVERVAGSRDSAVVLLRKALASGVVDSGAVAIQLARELYATNDAAAGSRVLIEGASTTSTAGQSAYRQELAWVAEPRELAAWDSLAPADRPRWLRQFWAGRDVSEGWPDGARLVEHYRRVEQAWRDFTLALPPSGRQIASSTTGGIDTFVDELLARRMNGAEGLSYLQDLEVAAADGGVGSGSDAQAVAAALANASQMKALGLDGPFRSFRTTQDVLDDRGVVWIRYGKPDKMVSSAGGLAMQVWSYERLKPRLVVQFQEENFDGQVGATRLVPSLISAAGRFRDQFCGIEPSLCAMVTSDPSSTYNDAAPLSAGAGRQYAQQKSDGGRLTPAMIDRVVREGAVQLARATTSDANPRPFSGAIDPLVQIYGLTRPESGRPLALIAFAIPGEQLLGSTPPAAAGRTVYSVRMSVALLDSEGRRLDVDTLRNFAVATALKKGQYLTGTLEIPVPAGRYKGSLLLGQSDGRGAVATLPGIGVPGMAGRLNISSIVLGRDGSGAAWRTGESTVPLNPLGTFQEGGSAELYYQVVGQTPGTKYQTILEFFDATSPDRSALTLRFEEEAGAGLREVQRTVGLSTLKPGRYTLRVTVEGGGARDFESSRLTVLKK